MNIEKEINISDFDGGRSWRCTARNERQLGVLVLNYFFQTQGWVLDHIESIKPGLGKNLVGEFVSYVGGGVRISTSSVTELQTNLALRGVVSRMLDDVFIVRDRKIINNLKLARVLQGGGVLIEAVHIEKGHLCDDSKEMIFMFGRTI